MLKIFKTAFIFACLSLFSISNAEVVKKIEKPSSPTIIHHKETKNPFNQLYL